MADSRVLYVHQDFIVPELVKDVGLKCKGRAFFVDNVIDGFNVLCFNRHVEGGCQDGEWCL